MQPHRIDGHDAELGGRDRGSHEIEGLGELGRHAGDEPEGQLGSKGDQQQPSDRQAGCSHPIGLHQKEGEAKGGQGHGEGGLKADDAIRQEDEGVGVEP